MKAIQVEKLRKSYGTHEVLRGLDLTVEQGEVFALLGVNGAGKTTALECIQGLSSYEEGQVWVNGRMGVQLQSASMPFYCLPGGMEQEWNRDCWKRWASMNWESSSMANCLQGKNKDCIWPWR